MDEGEIHDLLLLAGLNPQVSMLSPPMGAGV